jgi:ornithine cyclodeaminase/alanine dehydrogenase-like protein (mu-crystallin family)
MTEQMQKKTLVLPQNDVQDIVRHFGVDAVMDDLIKKLTVAIAQLDKEQTIIPIRSGFNYEGPQPGLVEWMPLYDKGRQVVIKLVGYHPQNPEKYGLPTILSTISAYDTHTGHLKSLMDGVLLTSLRTGAASAIATRLMAHPDSSTLGLIGCGAQAVTQLHAISRLFDIKKVLIYDIDPDTVTSFEERCSDLGLEAVIVSCPLEQIVGEADILCTATSIASGEGPLFSGLETKPHLHINAVGSDFPGKIEVPLDFLTSSFVCPDFRAQAVVEGECQQLKEAHIGADLAEVLNNEAAYSHVQSQRSVFDSTGWSLEDAVVMELFTAYARDLGLGKEMEIETIGGDAKSPYGFVGSALKQFKAETTK